MSDAPKRPGRKKGDPNHHRRGNGVGVQWGGPARGGVSNSKAGIAGPGRGITGKTVAELLIAMGAREEAAERWMDILKDPSHPKHADMVVQAARRTDGDPVQRQDVTSNGERVGFVIAAPPEAKDSAEWAKQHAPSAE
jgi:hypothetical protein